MVATTSHKQHLTYAWNIVVLVLSLLWLQVMFHPATVRAESQATGGISGRVAGSDGGDVTGILVRASRVSDDSANAEYWLDATGYYTLTNLPPGDYRVYFNQNDQSPYVAEVYDNEPLSWLADSVTVNAGEITRGIDAELELAGTIRGRVTSELTGEPLANVRVVARSYREKIAFTNADGYYAISGLSTYAYFVSFDGTPEYGSEYYPNSPSSDTAVAVSVTVGITVADIDAALPFIINITGRVEDPTASVASLLKVTAIDASGEVQASTYVDNSGYYTITGLTPAPYRIRYGYPFDTIVHPYYANHTLFEEADWITVTAGVVVRDVNVSLQRHPAVETQLRSAASRPGVLMALEHPNRIPSYTLDGGRSWHNFPTLPFLTSYDVPHFAVVPKDDLAQPVRFIVTSWASEWNGIGGIYRTGDGGVSWAKYVLTTSKCSGDARLRVEVLISSPVNPQRLYMLTSCAIVFFEGETYYTDFFTSADGGVTWQRLAPHHLDVGRRTRGDSSLLPSPVLPDRIYLRTYSSLEEFWQRSDDAGSTWITESFSATILLLDWHDPAKLYAVDDAQGTNVFRYTGKRSTDGGATWTRWAQQPCRTSLRQLLALPTPDTLLMLCDQGLYRSSNGGDLWRKLSTESEGSILVDTSDPTQVLWTQPYGISVSWNQGETWQALGSARTLLLPYVHYP